MTKRSALMLFATLSLALWGCNQLPDPEPGNRQSREITLSGSIGAYTRVAGNAFEAGDELGLFALTPVNATNVLITSDGAGAFTPSEKLYWGAEQKDNEATRFIAYYPFSGDASVDAPFLFSLPFDQRNGTSQADFLYASAESTPAAGGVNLPFNHIMSRMIITVDCLVEDHFIESVSVDGVVLDARVNLAAGTAKAEGQSGLLHPARVDDAFVFVLAPQTASPEIILQVSNGESVTFVPASAIDFASGKQIRARLVLDMDTVSSFTADIEDWVYESIDFQGQVPEESTGEHSWSVYIPDKDEMTLLEPTEDGLLQARVFDYGGEGFFLAKDETTAQLLGQVHSNYAYTPENASDIKLYYTDDYTYSISLATWQDILVSFDPASMTLSMEEVPYGWESLGTGKFVDGFITGLFSGMPMEEVDVEVLKAENYENLYGIENPYADARFTKYYRNFTVKPAVLCFVIREDDKVYFKMGPTGVSHRSYGCFIGFSLVAENGWGHYGYYGQLDKDHKYISFPDITATLCDAGLYSSNGMGMMSITLPGGTRTDRYYEIGDLSYSIDQDYVVSFSGTPELDVAEILFAVVPGTLDGETIEASLSDILVDSYCVDELERGFSFNAKWACSEPGDYTAVFVGEDEDGNQVSYNYLTFTVKIIDPAYYDWLGKWELLSWDGNYYTFDISADVEGESYWMNGFTVPAHLYLEDGCLVFYSGEVVYSSSKYTVYTMGMGDESFYSDEAMAIARFKLYEDKTTASVESLLGDVDTFGVYAYIIASDSWGFFGYTDLLCLPQKATKVQSYSAPARRLAGSAETLSDDLILKKK